MIRDANNINSGSELGADLCIVGAGAAGITLALRLLGSGLRIVVLEAGGLHADAATQALYEAEIVDPALHSPGDKYRARRFGGSTTLWGGRCVPFDPWDFTHRPWISAQAWPIGHDEVARWYPDANALLEAGACDYAAATCVPGGMRPMIEGFAPAHFNADGVERFSRPTNFATAYRARLAADSATDILLNANVTEIGTDAAGGRVTHIRVRTLAGNAFTVTPTITVLAAGGLEVARLLLASRASHAAGLGNAHGHVGRHYMCHIAGVVGRLTLGQAKVAHGYQVAPDGTYCRRRLALGFAAQQREQVASAVVRLHFPEIRNPAHRSGPLSALYLAKPLISYEYGKRLGGGGDAGLWLHHAANVATDPVTTALFLGHWLRKRSFAARKFPSVIVPNRTGLFSLDYHAEQVPNPDSRVSLCEATDRLGMPKLRIDWRYSRHDIETAQTTLRLLAQDLAAWGGGRLDYDPDAVEAAMTRDGAYGGHHIGTARMSAFAATGVVDANCRVHGLANLFIAGSAVFPTSSQANPTLTIVALALRLAEHLRRLATTRPALNAAAA